MPAPAPPLDDHSAQVALLALEAICDSLIGPRLSAKEIVTRAAALAKLRGHWRVRHLTVTECARRLGISHTALSRRMLAIPEELQARIAIMRRQIPSARKTRSVHRSRGKTRPKVSARR